METISVTEARRIILATKQIALFMTNDEAVKLSKVILEVAERLEKER